MALSGEANGNWRGGRSIASNGYVIVRVGVDHHLADVRGYAYEHRLVAEEKYGRRLKRGEQVHHVDGCKSNNAPENIEVLKVKYHAARHRGPNSRLIKPNGRNRLISCKCGCGERFKRYDNAGRPRRYIPGHNQPPSPTADAILKALRKGSLTVRQIIMETGKKEAPVKTCLSKLKRLGRAVNLTHGTWSVCNG